MKNKIDYNNTDDIVCPYCGWKNGDSWEIRFDGQTIKLDCDECNKEFECSAEDTRTYSSYKLDCVGKHKMKLDWAHILDEKYDYKEDRWIRLPIKDFEYSECFACEECEATDYKKLTKEEFRKKYPDKFKDMADKHPELLEEANNGNS